MKSEIADAIIYEKTVYRLIATLRKDRLTKKGYFDLEYIQDLRIIDNGFLKKLRGKYGKTQKELARIINVPLRTWIGWESYKKAVPFEKLLLLAQKLNIEKDSLYEFVQNCEFTLGEHHGKNRITLPVAPLEFSLLRYLIPEEYNRTYLIKTCPSKIGKNVIETFSIDSHLYHKKGLIVIQSYLLHKFLTTFYTYKKDTSLQFPLSAEVPLWMWKGIDLKAAILPLLLSDGGEKSGNRTFISGESRIIHNIWTDAWHYTYDLLPSCYHVTHGPIFVTEHKVPEKILNELHKICPTFKKSSIGTTKKNYLNGIQPTLSYFFKRPKTEQEIAIRLWANTEGSIGLSFDKETNLTTPLFQIACAHPILIQELQKLCKLNKINVTLIKEDGTWSGYSKLRTVSLTSVLEFVKIGGFLKGTKISTKSKQFHSLDKQETLLGILEFMLRQRKDSKYRTKNKQKAYEAIRNIVLNKEFQDEKHYLKAFANHDNWSFRRLQ